MSKATLTFFPVDLGRVHCTYEVFSSMQYLQHTNEHRKQLKLQDADCSANASTF
jgi:hypothetical protein